MIHCIMKFKLANESPVPKLDKTTNFRIRAGSSKVCAADRTALTDVSMNRGGEVVAAQGFPDVRVCPSVLMMTIGMDALVPASATPTSEALHGSPIVMVRFGC